MSEAPPHETSCSDLVEATTDYIEGTMPEGDRARLDAHLEECARCVNYLGQMRATIATIGELRDESLAPDTWHRLLEAFRDWATGVRT